MLTGIYLSSCAYHYREAAYSDPGSPVKITREIREAVHSAFNEAGINPEILRIRSATAVTSFDSTIRYRIDVNTTDGNIWRATMHKNADSNFEVDRVSEVGERASIFKPYASAENLQSPN